MWKGPIVDGITQSLINSYLECPFSFYIKTILGLKEEEEPSVNLIWGDTFHKGLEILLETKSEAAAIEAMEEHLTNRYPNAPPTVRHTTAKMLDIYRIKGNHMDVEWHPELLMDIEFPIKNYPVRFRGKLDGLCEHHPSYNRLLVEHKAKGYIDPLQVKDELPEDLQVNIYMYLHDVEYVAYDLIKIPEAQKYGPPPSYAESAAQWTDRIFHGPIGSYNGNYPIHKARHKWVHQGVHLLPRENQELYWSRTVIPLILRIIEWYEYVTSPEFNMDDPACYNSIFYRTPIRSFSGRRTESFKCPYYSYLIGEMDLSELTPTKSLFSELEDV